MANWKKIKNNPVREEADESFVKIFLGFWGLVVLGYVSWWGLAGIMG